MSQRRALIYVRVHQPTYIISSLLHIDENRGKYLRNICILAWNLERSGLKWCFVYLSQLPAPAPTPPSPCTLLLCFRYLPSK